MITVLAFVLCCVSVAYAGESAAAVNRFSISANGDLSSEKWINEKIYNASHNRGRWLYELMSAAGYGVSTDKSNGSAIFEQARVYGIIDDYTSEDSYLPLNRRFVCSTLVRALGYPYRNMGYIADIVPGESYMSTAAYFGYFLPDFNNMVYPDKAITDSEYENLLTELSRYHALKGKCALSFGDSIMYGTGNDGEGISEITAIKYGMTCYDFAVPGATFGQSKGRGHIPDQIRSAYKKYKTADVILLNGGTNDVNHTNLGKISSGYDMEKTSENDYTGAFERSLWLIKKSWKDVPIIYIRAHNMELGEDAVERRFGERAMDIAGKWKINAIDLYSDSGLNTEDPTMCSRYTYINPNDHYICDSIHPNAMGYAKFYLPPVAQALDTLFGEEAK